MTDLFGHAAADNVGFEKSRTILTPAAATYNVIRIPKNAFVTDVWLLVTTAGSSNTVSVGWIGNGEAAVPTGFLSVDIADVMTAGLKRSTKDTLVNFTGKYFSAAGGAITVTVGTTQSTGLFHVFVQFHVIY